MGKKSLIKSTSKKTKAKTKDEETKTKTGKTAAKAAKSTKSKTSPKKTAKTKAKSTVKKTASKAGKTTKKKAARKPTLRRLLLKKFEAPPVEKLFRPPAAVRKGSAPPLIDTGDKDKAAVYRQLLARSFSMEQLAEAARRAAEEKAAREKAEAEKKAAEEAAAKKAAEEAARRAAEEKAAREKAEAEKKAAEEKAKAKTPPKPARQEDTPVVKVSYEKEEIAERAEKKEKDPVESAMKIFIAGLAFLILLVVGASINNSGKYYIKEHDGAIEITKGKFAPLGEKHFITLPGVKAPEVSKEFFSRKEVYPLIFGYYLEKADNLLQSEGLPDFEGIKAYLEKALVFATDNQMRSEVYRRIDNIDRIVLMYKAEVAMSKDTPESLEEALEYLQEAKTLAEDEDHKNLIQKRIERVKERLAALEAEAKAEAEAEAAAEEAESKKDEARPEGTQAAEAGEH